MQFRLFLWLLILVSSGCTFNERARIKAETALDERVRELVQAALKANQIGAKHQATAAGAASVLPSTPETAATISVLKTNLSKATQAYELSGEMLERGGAIVGDPVKSQTELVNGLLSENAALRLKAEAADRARQSDVEKLLTEKREAESKLLKMGAELERERNTNIVKRVWTWSIATFGIGGLIALCFFFPVLIPIVGRLLAWLVHSVPSLASWLGVVSVKAYDRLVDGVNKSKEAYEKSTDDTPIEEVFDRPFREAMADDNDKKLVRHRKAALLTKKKLNV